CPRGRRRLAAASSAGEDPTPRDLPSRERAPPPRVGARRRCPQRFQDLTARISTRRFNSRHVSVVWLHTATCLPYVPTTKRLGETPNLMSSFLTAVTRW